LIETGVDNGTRLNAGPSDARPRPGALCAELSQRQLANDPMMGYAEMRGDFARRQPRLYIQLAELIVGDACVGLAQATFGQPDPDRGIGDAEHPRELTLRQALVDGEPAQGIARHGTRQPGKPALNTCTLHRFPDMPAADLEQPGDLSLGLALLVQAAHRLALRRCLPRPSLRGLAR
jgi:hypothetical protein